MKISVVIPTHNRHKELGEAVKSVFAQSRPPDEIIVVDDGSYPPIGKKIFTGCPAGAKTKLFRNDRPMGANNARNLGIRYASGEWVAFLDDDDRFKPGKTEAVCTAIEKNPEADIVYHPAEIHMVKENVIYRTKPAKFDESTDIFSALLIKNLVGGTPMVTAKRESLIKAGLFDDKLPALQDYDLWIRMAKNGCRFCCIDQPLTEYYCTTKEKSLSKSIATNRKALGIIENKYNFYYLNLSSKQLQQHEAWKKKMLVHKALLNGRVWVAFKEQVKCFAIKPHPRHLLGAMAIFLGKKITYILRARLG